jgi:hypothetical protein
MVEGSAVIDSRVLSVLVAATLINAQKPGEQWMVGAHHIAVATVMVEDKLACRGAGIIVGADRTAIRVVTAAHLLQGLGPDDLQLRFRIGKYGDTNMPEHVVPARVLSQDPNLDVALLQAESAPVTAAISQYVKLDYVGDSRALLRNDQVYAVGCGTGEAWDIPVTLDRVLTMSAKDQAFYFQSSYVREGFSGGPVVQVIGDSSYVVGIVRSEQPRVRSVLWHEVHQALTRWKHPFDARPYGTIPNCSYQVASNRLEFNSKAGERKPLQVDTAPECGWGTSTDGSFWLAVLTLPGFAPAYKAKGPGQLAIGVVENNFCDGSVRTGELMVAGQRVRVVQDGTDLGVGCK